MQKERGPSLLFFVGPFPIAHFQLFTIAKAKTSNPEIST
jgi:hypothetical protein